MPGQREQQFRGNTGFRTPGDSAAPTVSTASYEATAARVDSNAQGLNAIGNALGNFFGGVNRSIETVDDTLQRQRIVQIDRENEALQKQAVVDQKEGRTVDPAYSNRQAYVGAYQASAADTHAFEMTEGLKAKLADMPRDGSQNPQAVAEQYFKDNYTGSGDKDFDSRLLFSYTKQAESLVAAGNEQKRADAEFTASRAIIEDATGQLVRQGEITGGQFADVVARVQTVTHGDLRKADKLVGLAMGNAQNQTQALSVLKAASDSGWAERNPVEYQELEKKLVQQTNSTKTMSASIAVQQWQQDLHALALNPNASMNDYASLAVRAHAIDSVHGTGDNPFLMLNKVMAGMAKKEAAVNLYAASMQGVFNGSHDGPAYAMRAGESHTATTKKYMDDGIAQVVRESSNYPALKESMGATGYIDPLASDSAVREFTQYIASPNQQATAPYGMSDRLTAQVSGALMNNDPAKANRSYTFYRDLEASPSVGTDGLSKYFSGNAEAENRYRGLKALEASGVDVKTLMQSFKDNPLDADKVIKGAKSGSWNWAELTGKPEKKPGEADSTIQAALDKAMLSDAERKRWFFNASVGMSSSDRNELMGLVASDVLLQKRAGGGSADLGKAVETAVAQVRGRNIAIPGWDGTLQLMKDPFNQHGRGINDPLNADPSSPVSITKGFKPIYAGFKMQNKFGVEEDPLVTFKEDVSALAKAAPGVAGDPDGIWLEKPLASGLMRVMKRDHTPIQLAPGSKFQFHSEQDVPVETSVDGVPVQSWTREVKKEDVTVPKDPSEAAAFFKTHLPPGYFAVPNGVADPVTGAQAYALHYGMRIKGDDEAVKVKTTADEKARDERNAERAQRIAASPGAQALNPANRPLMQFGKP